MGYTSFSAPPHHPSFSFSWTYHQRHKHTCFRIVETSLLRQHDLHFYVETQILNQPEIFIISDVVQEVWDILVLILPGGISIGEVHPLDQVLHHPILGPHSPVQDAAGLQPSWTNAIAIVALKENR